MDEERTVHWVGWSGYCSRGCVRDWTCREVSSNTCYCLMTASIVFCWYIFIEGNLVIRNWTRQTCLLLIQHPRTRLLLSEGYEPDILYTSRLKRAVKSTWTILNALNAPYLPVYKSWRLNERNYGALTGLKKMDAAKELGMEVVQAWRNSLKARPPMMKVEDEWYPGKDRRYEDLTKEQIPLTESLMDCMERGESLYLQVLI